VAGFEPVRLLGRGGFAEVFLYQQSTPRRQVALKVLHTTDLGDKAIEQLAVEADTMAELSTHPHIATIYTSGLTDDGRPYLAMEYCPKPSLNIGLRTVRRTISEVLGIGVEIAGAVETAHRAGVLHRDIKPANILVTQYDNPVLTDFGIAVSVRQSTDQVEGLSVPWSPPEAFTQPPTAGPPSDVWGLAATVYSLLAGRAPFEVTGGDNTATVQMGRIECDVLPPVGRVDCPASLDRVLAVGMAKDPEKRYATALVFGRALQRVQAELGIDQTRMVIQSDTHSTPPVAEVHDGHEDTLTRLRNPRLVDQPELTRQSEQTGQADPTAQRIANPQPDESSAPEHSASAGRRPCDETLLAPTVPAAPGNQSANDNISAVLGEPTVKGTPTENRCGTEHTTPAKKSRRLGLTAALVAAGLLLASGVGIGAWWFAQRGTPPPDMVADTNRVAKSGQHGEDQADSSGNPAAEPLSKCATPPAVTVHEIGLLGAAGRISLGLEATCAAGDILDHSTYEVEVSDAYGPLALGTIFIGERPLGIAPLGMRILVDFDTIYATLAEQHDLGATLTPLGTPMTYDPALVESMGGTKSYPANESDLTAEELNRAAMAALERQAAGDFPMVTAQLEGYWVPQISSKYVGMDAAGIIWGPEEIWQQFLEFRDRYPNAVLTDSNQWTCYRPGQRYWVISVPQANADAAGALGWCTAQGMGRDECYAKRIGNTGFEGATAFND